MLTTYWGFKYNCGSEIIADNRKISLSYIFVLTVKDWRFKLLPFEAKCLCLLTCLQNLQWFSFNVVVIISIIIVLFLFLFSFLLLSSLYKERVFLPRRMWQEFLGYTLSSVDLLVFAFYIFVIAPNDMRMCLLRHLHSNPTGATMIRTYLTI